MILILNKTDRPYDTNNNKELIDIMILIINKTDRRYDTNQK
jgi:hypothetical protein